MAMPNRIPAVNMFDNLPDLPKGQSTKTSAVNMFDNLPDLPKEQPTKKTTPSEVDYGRWYPTASTAGSNVPSRLWGALAKGEMAAAQGVLKIPEHIATAFVGPAPKGMHTAGMAKRYNKFVEEYDHAVETTIRNHPDWAYEPPKSWTELVTNPDKLAYTIAESVPLLLNAGIITAAGAAPLAVTMMFASEGQQAYDEAYQDLIASGESKGEAKRIANQAYFIYGAPAAVIEMMQLGQFGKLGKLGYQKLLGRSVQKLAGKGVKSFTRETIKTVINEAMEEMLQQGWQETTAKLVYDKSIEGGLWGLIDRLAQAGTVAGIMTLLTGAGGVVAGKMVSDLSTKTQIEPESAAQVVRTGMEAVDTNASVEEQHRQFTEAAEEAFMVERKISKFPGKITDAASLKDVGTAIAADLGVDVGDIPWVFKTQDSPGATAAVRMDAFTGKPQQIVMRVGKGSYKTDPKYAGRRRWAGAKPTGLATATQSDIKRVLIHELGHIAEPFTRSKTGQIIGHHPAFAKWVNENVPKLLGTVQVEEGKPRSTALGETVEMAAKPMATEGETVGQEGGRYKIYKLNRDGTDTLTDDAFDDKKTAEAFAATLSESSFTEGTFEVRDEPAAEAQMAAKPTGIDLRGALEERAQELKGLAEEKKLAAEKAKERKFKKPSVTHFVTPQLYEAEKLGVRFMTKPSEVGKQRLDIEFNRHVRDLDKIERVINKLGGETIKSKAMAKLKNKPTKSIVRFAELLNTHENAPAELSDKETDIFNYFRNLSRALFARENEVRAKLNMEPIIYKSGYVRHIVDMLANEIIDGKHPIPEDLKYWAEEKVKTKIHNPMEFQRQLGDELESIFSKDIIRLSKAMMWTGLREIHLSEPLKFFEAQLALHSEVIPSATRKWTEGFINHMIKGQPTDLDKSLDALVTESGLNGLFNKILAPFGRMVSNRPLTHLMQKAGRLQIYGVMGWRPKQLIRNKFQIVQNLALYGIKASLKSFLPANKQLKGLLSESLFLETYKGFEDLADIDKKTLGRLWLAPFQWTAITNVQQAMKAAYWDTLDLIENPKYREFGWADPKRTYKEESGFLYESEKSKILGEMEFGGGVTQYHYIPMAMPEVFRHKALTPLTRLQSWWMNHFFNFHDVAARRFFTGETGYEDGGRLPWSRRIGWARYMVIGGVILNTMGYTRSYLLGAAPDSFPPAASLLVNIYLWLKAVLTGNKRVRQSAERKMFIAARTFIPGYLAYKDVEAVASGEKGPIELFFYGKQEGQTSGRRSRRKRPTRKTRRRR